MTPPRRNRLHPRSWTWPAFLRNKHFWRFGIAGTMLVTGIVLFAINGSRDDAQPAADKPAPGEVSLSTALSAADAGSISSATFDEASKTLSLTTTAPLTTAGDAAKTSADEDGSYTYSAAVPVEYVATTLDTLLAHGVDVRATASSELTHAPARDFAELRVGRTEGAAATTSSGGISQSIGYVPLFAGLGLLVVFTFMLLADRARHRHAETTGDDPSHTHRGASPKGRKHHGHIDEASVPATRFTDVAGAEEAVLDLTEMVEYLRDPERFTRLGAKPPKGALLVGPPGTGKTLLARAVAGEAGVPFYQSAGSDFVEKYVGVGAQRIRDLFKAARSHEKAILFIDEIDAIARRRSDATATGNNQETENTLISLLSELDGFENRGNILVIAATNRADILDPAVTRPGRLDRKVEVPNPDRRGREQILSVHSADRPIAEDVDLVHVARRTPGFSGAQLEAIVNEACMVAARSGYDEVTSECFDFAVATVAMGRARESALVTDYDREVTAWHEAGHTLAAFLIPEADDPVQVTIVPRGPAGGVTWMSGSDDIFLARRKAHARLVVALAGRAGEELLLDGEYTQGAHGDLTSATQTATAMVTQYGMSKLGYAVRNNADSAEVIEAVNELLDDAHGRATQLLGAHQELMADLVVQLLDEETLTLEQIRAIAAAHGVVPGTAVELPPLPERKRREHAVAKPVGPVALSGTRSCEPVVIPGVARKPGARRVSATEFAGRVWAKMRKERATA